MQDAKVVGRVPTPVGKRVCVKLKVVETSVGGIQLPTTEVSEGEVISVGCPDSGLSEKDVVFLPRGDRVGDKFKVGDDVYLITNIDYISAIL